MNSSRVIVALDFSERDQALRIAQALPARECRLKVGKELFTAAGPEIVAHLVAEGFDVFLDLKFHDIPNTVQRACVVACDTGVWMLNVHACGGKDMLAAARAAVPAAPAGPLLIAVTVLTSMTETDLLETGCNRSVRDQVLHLAALSRDQGLDGVVCSPHEAALLRNRFGEDFTLVTPGVRPVQADANDQKRLATPLQALQAGSDYLVIGRPITQAAEPAVALRDINRQLAASNAAGPGKH